MCVREKGEEGKWVGFREANGNLGGKILSASRLLQGANRFGVLKLPVRIKEASNGFQSRYYDARLKVLTGA